MICAAGATRTVTVLRCLEHIGAVFGLVEPAQTLAVDGLGIGDAGQHQRLDQGDVAGVARTADDALGLLEVVALVLKLDDPGMGLADIGPADAEGPAVARVDVVIVQRSPPPRGTFSGATSLASFEGAASALTLPRPSRGATRRRPPRRAARRCLSAYPALPDDDRRLEHLLARFHAGSSISRPTTSPPHWLLFRGPGSPSEKDTTFSSSTLSASAGAGSAPERQGGASNGIPHIASFDPLCEQGYVGRSFPR